MLEAAARHAVAVAGSRIQEATEHAREHPHLGIAGITAALKQTQQRLQTLGERLRYSRGAPGSLIAAALGGTLTPTTRPIATQAGDPTEITTDTPAAPLTTRAVIQAEREVLTTCLTNPQIRTELLGWLTPGDFSRPKHATTWAALGALTQAGTPIDYVTLAWECERHHPDHDSPGLRADQLATMAHHPPTTPTTAVRTVAHAALLRHTDTAHQRIEALSHSQADALTVVSGAAEAYRDLHHHAHRLSGAPPAPSRISAALNPTTPPPPMPPSPPDHHRGR